MFGAKSANKDRVDAGQAMKLTAVLCVGLLGAAITAAHAQTGSGATPLKMEVMGAAGGLVDIVPRRIAPYLATAIGAPVVVENRPGAGGNIAAGFVAKAQPDGNTLLVTSTNQAVNPTLLPSPGFDYERDLAPVAMLVSAKLVLVAAPSFPGKTISDVLELAKQKPKLISIAAPNIGTPNYLAAEMLAQYGGVDLTFVPYTGIAPAIPDVMANRVDLAAGAISTMLPLVRSGALQALAVISPQRSPLAPDIPTSAEAGMAALQIDNWICIMTTGGTPAPIIARLDAAIAEVLALPEVRDAFAQQGVEIFYMNAQQLGAFMHAEAARFAALLKNSRVAKPPQ
jgi:tripartite-type tricarboxylate transporter receptor subunit TctC